MVKKFRENPTLGRELLNIDAHQAALHYKVEKTVSELLSDKGYFPSMEKVKAELTTTQALNLRGVKLNAILKENCDLKFGKLKKVPR